MMDVTIFLPVDRVVTKSQVLDAWEEYQAAKAAAAAVGIRDDELVEEAAQKYRRIWAQYVEQS